MVLITGIMKGHSDVCERGVFFILSEKLRLMGEVLVHAG